MNALPDMDTLAAKMAELGHEYRAQLPMEIDQLAALAQSLVRSPANFPGARKTLVNVHLGLHKLAGGAGTFGLDELSRAARALEATAKTWLNTDFTTVDDAQRRQFSAAVAALAVAAGLPGTNLSAH